MDRRTLVRTLAAFDPADFATLIATIPRAAMHVSRHATVPEQAAELIRWAEGPTGPGLAAIEVALAYPEKTPPGQFPFFVPFP
ncbi:MAG TPA: hypothetical protein VKA15_14090, partial [Isosphaeraceae bacterium]|nr:hypothetical protein [Isosphaeraceae bacterium]